MNRIPLLLILLLTLLLGIPCLGASSPSASALGASPLNTDSLTWYDGTAPVRYHLASPTTPVVRTALRLLSDDLLQVTGQTPEATNATNAPIQVVELDRLSRRAQQRLRRRGVAVDSLLSHPDAFQIHASDGTLWIAGGNGRGTAYGLLELSHMAGVSPLIWWGDVVPQPRQRLTVAADLDLRESPDVTFRGIFVNDEDWSFRPWACHRSAAEGGEETLTAESYQRLFELLLRLRANMIWPAMHEGTPPFYTIEGARAAADSCGIVIGTSHCEPLMRNNVSEWDVTRRGRYNYLTNRDSVLQYWSERLQEVAGSECFYTLGMRGIHDGPMEGVKTLDEQTSALQQVIDDQRTLLRRYVRPEVSEVPQSFVPYKEVLQVMEHGLNLPDDVTLVWCDDNYGYLTRLPDSLQQQRSGGGGIYYHLSYWGRPHDYLWLTCTQPGLIYEELSTAYQHGVRKLWIANVHDPKVALYQLSLFLGLAWDVHCVSPQTMDDYMRRWLCDLYGKEIGTAATPLLREFYRLTAIRRPEFMGWCQNELDKKVYPRGLSPVRDTEFTPTAWGDELRLYLDAWLRLKQRVNELATRVPERLHDAYYAQMFYPLTVAADMSQKLLEAQRAREMAAMNVLDSIPTYAARSLAAYDEIRRLTTYYNDTLAGGKWHGSMSDHPRNQLVFEAPKLPDVALPDDTIQTQAIARKDLEIARKNPAIARKDSVIGPSYVARNAYAYDRSEGAPCVIDQLGHSMHAVAVPLGSTLSYDFNMAGQGDADTARITIALIPTHPSDRGDLRFSLQIDDDAPHVCTIREGFRTEPWKQNVLRAQVLRSLLLPLAPGRHTLTLSPLDDHIVFDQWMVDFDTQRKYYMIPAGE
jgi:hypothetical protein